MEDLVLLFEEHGKPLRLILLLDEVESVIPHPWSQSLFNQLRSLIYDSPLADTVKLVLTGSAQVVQVREEGSPLLNAVKIVHLEPLPQSSVCELATRGGRLDTQVAEAVFLQSGGHPFIAQYLLHYLWAMGFHEATVPDTERFARQMRQIRSGDFHDWWMSVGDGGRQAYVTLMDTDP